MINNKFIIKIYFLKYLVQEIEKTGTDGGHTPPFRAEANNQWIARNIFDLFPIEKYSSPVYAFYSSLMEYNCYLIIIWPSFFNDRLKLFLLACAIINYKIQNSG